MNEEAEETKLVLPIGDKKVTNGRTYLQLLLNKSMKIEISDGRTLIGQFLCTDCDKNIILGSCQEFIGTPDDENTEEPRILGLAMIPGRHVKKMHIDMDEQTRNDINFIMGKQTMDGKSIDGKSEQKES